jgi:hypothetical protein
MLFSTSGPLAVAFAASFACATPLNVPAPAAERSLDLIKPVSVNIDLDNNWSGVALVEGYCNSEYDFWVTGDVNVKLVLLSMPHWHPY